MPNRVEPGDFLYRRILPAHVQAELLTPDAYIDKYEKQSFQLASVCHPKQVLEKFAHFKGTRKACKKGDEDPDPTCAEMYDAGYCMAVTSVEVIRVHLNLELVPEADGSEYRNDGHVNVKNAKLKASSLADPANSRILTREETLGI